jgi:16S rRNA (guanine(966)-N(2))-methyltransferase RsmD
LRVISGSAKGKKLKAPAGLNTRPITDMIKEALFNVLGAKVPNAKLLDLFAGSGSVGIEALSRGAQSVVFVDNSVEALKVVKENLNNCSFTREYHILRNDVFKALGLLKRHNSKFDLIYVDPPFTNEKIFNEIMEAIDVMDILEPEGIVIIRTPRRKEMPIFDRLQEYRLNHYGESSLHYYRRCEEDPKDDGNFSHIG